MVVCEEGTLIAGSGRQDYIFRKGQLVPVEPLPEVARAIMEGLADNCLGDQKTASGRPFDIGSRITEPALLAVKPRATRPGIALGRRQLSLYQSRQANNEILSRNYREGSPRRRWRNNGPAFQGRSLIR